MMVTIPRPDDWHVHLRDGAMMRAVLPYTAQQFGRAVVMPNLKPPIATSVAAKEYRDRIIAALPRGEKFMPLMTAYLTDRTDCDDLRRGFEEKIFFAAKLYPANATTNSEMGVTDIQIIAPVMEKMQSMGMPLLVHGEVADKNVDIFDREAIFIDKVLTPLRKHFPALKITMEHITTREAVEYVVSEGQGGLLGATITAHHLRINRNAIFAGGIRPHNYCLPIAKREIHRQALVAAATSGGSMFFLGTDSAPHSRGAKECECGCAGIFTAPDAMSLYAESFYEAGALDRLADFASVNGPCFYGLPVSEDKVKLVREKAKQEALKPILTEDGAEIVRFNDAGYFWRMAD